MRWLAKALFQKAVSPLPGGERFNYFFQHRVFRNLPAPEPVFARKVSIAVHHFTAWLQFYSRAARADACWYEFGVGRDLIVPLAHAALGVERQVLVDFMPMLHFELINDTLLRLNSNRARFTAENGHYFRPMGATRVHTAAELKVRFGIEYRAPSDARSTGLPTGSVDFLSSTDTLEHIAPADLCRILAECRRILKPRCVASFWVVLTDHYATFDRRLSSFNFLRFSDSAWRLVNSELHYQNRLRAPDYIRLIAEAGFEVVTRWFEPAREEEMVRLRRTPIAPRFRSIPEEELAARELWVVARSPS